MANTILLLTIHCILYGFTPVTSKSSKFGRTPIIDGPLVLSGLTNTIMEKSRFQQYTSLTCLGTYQQSYRAVPASQMDWYFTPPGDSTTKQRIANACYEMDSTKYKTTAIGGLCQLKVTPDSSWPSGVYTCTANSVSTNAIVLAISPSYNTSFRQDQVTISAGTPVRITCRYNFTGSFQYFAPSIFWYGSYPYQSSSSSALNNSTGKWLETIPSTVVTNSSGTYVSSTLEVLATPPLVPFYGCGATFRYLAVPAGFATNIPKYNTFSFQSLKVS